MAIDVNADPIAWANFNVEAVQKKIEKASIAP